MLWRHLCLVRAITAAGLLTFSTLGAQASGEPEEPLPGADAQAETVKVLEAEKAGMLAVDVRGNGQDKVKISLKNSSSKRLNVVLPPGLVASSATAQGGAGGGAGGAGGFQSMGLGATTNRSGGFGQFAGTNGGQAGFQSIPATESKGGVTVPAGQTVDIEIPAVCLNFGLPTPTPRNKFRLVDVDDFSKDIRVRKALRALATLGTSQGMAQAAMWRICNDVPFEMMLSQGSKVVNPAEVALAARFLEILDRSSETVDPAYLTDARLFVTIEGEGLLAKDARRLSASIEGLRVLGLPVHVTALGEVPKTLGPALHLGISLSMTQAGETRGRIVIQAANGLDGGNDWSSLGQVSFKEPAASALDGVSLARTLDHAVSAGFVSAKVSRKSTGSTTLKIENRLPFTLNNLTVKTGNTAEAGSFTLSGLGVGPNRTGLATIPAAGASVDRVELNGL
jgi:hypothetical protein